MQNQNSSTSGQKIQEILLESIQTAVSFEQNQINEKDGILDANKFTSSLIDTESNILTESEKELINNLCKLIYFSRRQNPINFNIKNEFTTKNQSKDKLKALLANFLAIPIKRVVTFAQNLPDFAQLEVDERISLLKEATIGITITASSSIYDSKSNIYKNMISRDGNVYEDDSNMDLSFMKNIWTEDLFLKTVYYLKSLNELCFDEACLAIFLIIILFSGDNDCCKDKVTSICSKYCCLLRKYVQWKTGDRAEKIYTMLLSKLPELKTLGQIHVEFIQDVDPKTIDQFLLAFIFSKQNPKSCGFDETDKESVKYEL